MQHQHARDPNYDCDQRSDVLRGLTVHRRSPPRATGIHLAIDPRGDRREYRASGRRLATTRCATDTATGNVTGIRTGGHMSRAPAPAATHNGDCHAPNDDTTTRHASSAPSGISSSDARQDRRKLQPGVEMSHSQPAKKPAPVQHKTSVRGKGRGNRTRPRRRAFRRSSNRPLRRSSPFPVLYVGAITPLPTSGCRPQAAVRTRRSGRPHRRWSPSRAGMVRRG